MEPDARLDPAQLQEAVHRADFTPTGVRVWLRGTFSTDEPSSGADPTRWLVTPGSGQRFRLVADSVDGTVAIESLQAGAAGSIVLYGRAVASEPGSQVTVHVEGIDEAE